MTNPFCAALVVCLLAGCLPARAAEPTLDEIYTTLHAKRFVDLTHDFGPGIPHWKGFEDERIKTLYTYESAGFLAQEFSHVGQRGTHVDPPAHFVKGLRTVDQIRPDEMLLRLVVLDIHEKVAANPDTVVTMDDVRAWETRHGPIPEGAFVALSTDWSKRWPDEKAIQNTDDKGVSHYPGWSKPVLQYLYETRNITASGHETTDTDPGLVTTKDDYSLERYVLGTNHYQIELLANLDQVPETDCLVMVSFPKPKNGSGFPARVIAILP
jgi:kynurenine formamidase